METHKDQHKVQLIFTPRALASLKRLKTRIGTTSQADAVRYAIDLVLCIADEIDKGNSFWVGLRKEEIQKIFFPFLAREANAPEDMDSLVEPNRQKSPIAEKG